MKYLERLHWFMIRFRLMANSLLIFIMYLMWNMWEFYQLNFEALEVSSGGVFGAAWLALIGVVKFCLEHILQSHKKDE